MKASLKDRISARLAELDRNPFEAARLGGLERSFVNDILINRKQSVRGASLAKLAVALDWPVSALLDGVAEVSGQSTHLLIVGRIGAGAQIDVSVEQVPEGGEPIETIIPLPAGAIGFEVVGDSMWPRYDPGDVIVCIESGVALDAIPDGEEAAVRTSEGLRYLKRLVRSEIGGLFNLESHNAATIRGVSIDWASDVVAVIRATKWRRITTGERTRLVRSAMAKR